MLCFFFVDYEAARISSFIQNICAGSTLLSDIGSSLTYTLPTDDLPCFDNLFTTLSSNLEELGIAGYGVSDSTLYEVREYF